MAYDIITNTVSIIATTSFKLKQFTFVTIDTNGGLATPAAGRYAVGVIQDNPLANSPGGVALTGCISRIFCGAAFGQGAVIATDGNGYAVSATSGTAVLGIALTAGVSGGVAVILFQPIGHAW